MLVQTRLLHDIEDLRQVVKGADVIVSQIEPGPLSGSLTHGALGDFSMSLGHFSKAVRSHGIMSRDRQVIGMLLGRDDAVTHWSFDVRPGDVIFDHLGGTLDGMYKAGARFATIALSPAALTGLMAGEAAMADFGFWQHRTQIRPDAQLGAAISQRFATIIQRLDQHADDLSPAGSEFWMRALVEAFVGAMTGGVPWDGNRGPVRSALLVRSVEEYARAHSGSPIHISQLCQALGVSRRTLHRAFHDVLGIGPVAYLRRLRLNGVRQALLEGRAQEASINRLALDFGFDEVGRFAGYYRQLFNERPSETATKVRRDTE